MSYLGPIFKRLSKHRILSAQFEKPLLLYHGTSSKFLRSILKHGLTPASKEGRWVTEDKDASEQSRSRASYGGVYFASNLGTAISAATNLITNTESYDNRTSNVIVVCAELQPSSTIGDEDDYKFDILNGGRITDSMIPNVLALLRSNIKYSGSYDSERYNKQTYDLVKSNIDYLIHRYAPSYDLRKDKNKLTKLAQEVVLTELERKIAYRSIRAGTKSYYSYDNEAKKTIDRINYRKGGLPYGEPLPKEMRSFSKEKAEQRARSALDLFIKATKTYSKQNLEEQRDNEYRRGTTRIMAPVTFAGRNKITCIVEFIPSKTEKYGSDVVLHYGNIPTELKRQYMQTKGPWPKVFNKIGEQIEASDAINVNQYSIKHIRTEKDESPGNIDYYEIIKANKPIVSFRITNLDYILEIDIDDGYQNVVNKLGPTVLRKLIKDIKKLYPQAEQLVGLRTTGARAKAGKTWDEASIKLQSALNSFVVEAAVKTPLITVDVQPAYEEYQRKSFKTTDMMNFLNEYPGPILCLINAEDMGLTDDTKEAIKYHYIENGLKLRTLNRLVMVDKGYGHLRSWMDNGISHKGIIQVLRHMLKNNITDSRDLFEEAPEKAKEYLSKEDYAVYLRTNLSSDPLSLGWIEDKLLRKFKGAQICGGGRNECLAEVLILMDALEVPYTILDKYVY